MPGGITLSWDPRPEEQIRRSMRRWWSVAVALVVWLIYFNFGEAPKPGVPYVTLPLYVAVLVTIGGVLAGHVFGYKFGIAPFFLGVYMFDKPELKPYEKFRRALSKLQGDWYRLRIWNAVLIKEGGGHRLILCHEGHVELETTAKPLGEGLSDHLFGPEDLERAMNLTGATEEDVDKAREKIWHNRSKFWSYWIYARSVLREWRWKLKGGWTRAGV